MNQYQYNNVNFPVGELTTIERFDSSIRMIFVFFGCNEMRLESTITIKCPQNKIDGCYNDIHDFLSEPPNRYISFNLNKLADKYELKDAIKWTQVSSCIN